MRKPRFWQVVVLVGIIEIVVVVLFLSGDIPPAPDLKTPPEESRRAVHPAGYSIVVPRNYKAVFTLNDISPYFDELDAKPESGHARYQAIIHVRRLIKRPDWVPAQFSQRLGQFFQGQPAIIETKTVPGKYESWTATFQRFGTIFEVSLTLPDRNRGNDSMPPPAWMPFLESFRYEPPTTAPATTSAAQ